MADQPSSSVKRPASQYYWGDWWKDKGLHSCSLAARGLWHEMNCLMHEGEPYGHLTLNGRPMSEQQLANQCRITPSLCKKLVEELLAAGVPSRAESGALFSRRMVRDERVRNARAAGGKEGAEHGAKGAEHGSKGGRPAKTEGGGKTPLPPAPKPPPSSSSSPSPSVNTSPPSGAPSATPVAPAPPAPPPEPAPPAAAPKEPRAGKKCPDAFQVTQALVQWAGREYPNVGEDPNAMRRETQAFRDHTFSRVITDWPGAWRNWIKKASETLASRTRPIGTPSTRTTERRETVARHFPAVAERRGPPPRETIEGDVRDVTPRNAIEG